MIEKVMETGYQQFLKKVSKFRNKSVEDIHKVGEGHIFSGEDAVKVGIIDEVGGLIDAINYLKEKLNSEKLKVIYYPTIKYTLVEKLFYQNKSASVKIPDGFTELTSLFNLSTSALFRNNSKVFALMPEYLNLDIKKL